MDTHLVAKVEQNINDKHLIGQGNGVVVAVSGGPDSVALLHVLFALSGTYGWKLIVAHVNHRFRGAESDEEADYVAELAAALSLSCEIGSIDVPAYIEESMLNAQAAAREKRYEFLHAVAEKYGAQQIALAHHADDQAETIMMRLLRGTGPSGLAGMPERRREKKVELIRPCLRIYKSELVQYCLQRGLAYCQDSSNDSRKYFRNQVRLDVLPMLGQYNEQLPEALNRLAEMMQAEDDYLEAEAAEALRRTVTLQPSSCRFAKPDFVQLHIALQRRLIKLILNYLSSWTERHDFSRMEAIRQAILQDRSPCTVMAVHEQLYFVKEYDTVRFQREAPASAAFAYELPLEASEAGELPLPEAGARLSYQVKTADFQGGAHSPVMEAWFDLDRVELPLVLRSRKSGDRIEPHGLNGSKKVKDMFIDAKMPPSRRDAIPLLVDASGQVLWIAGFRRSGHALIREDTVRALHMKLMLN